MANLEPDEIEGYRKLAAVCLAKGETEMDGYVAEGELSEIEDDEEKEN
jgi:hypothetical protein